MTFGLELTLRFRQSFCCVLYACYLLLFLSGALTWARVDGNLVDITVSEKEVLGVNGADLVHSCPIDSDGNPNGAWELRPGKLKQISANANGLIVGCNASQQIFFRGMLELP